MTRRETILIIALLSIAALVNLLVLHASYGQQFACY